MTAGIVIVLVLQDRLTSVLNPGATAMQVLARVQAAKPRVILDLGALRNIDCSGIGFVAALYRTARGRGGDLGLLRLRERPRRLLEVCGLLRVIPEFETEEAALESIVGRDDSELYLEREPVQVNEKTWWRPTGLGLPLHGTESRGAPIGRSSL
jgi:anti-anti-sigma factor